MATPATAVSGLIQNQTLAQLRKRVYLSRMPGYNLMRSETGKVLHPVASNAARAKNFQKFVELYFFNTHRPNNADPFHGDFGLNSKLTKGSRGYIEFEKFAMQDYGSYVIKTMIDDPKKYKGFQVWEGPPDVEGAHGDWSFISLPKNFGTRKRFATSGQLIHLQAIIYHEFAHTMMFRKAQSRGIDIGINDERIAVLKFENPVRIRDGFEPRYTYAMKDGSATINIITGTSKPGKWYIRKNDPTVLVKETDPNALK
ncbi:MAG: hypothetical protein OEY52_13300 [Gammaproteobacteria bacterium]|nr:hypothetical protein [Gammaproteobacteria bacterium]